jgi:hypothetical protein
VGRSVSPHMPTRRRPIAPWTEQTQFQTTQSVSDWQA